jgi:hypothetical protein
VNAETVKLAGPRVGQEHVPDLFGLFTQLDPHFFVRRVEIIEQAKINRSRVLGEDGKVDAVTEPGGAEWIRFTGRRFEHCHKRATFLSVTQSSRAIRDCYATRSL